MALNSSQTSVLLIVLITLCSIIGILILVICATIICRHYYKVRLRKRRNKSYDETISKSQSTVTIYRNRKASRMDSVTATDVDEESITALVKKYNDTKGLENSVEFVKHEFDVKPNNKDNITADVFVTSESSSNKKGTLMKEISCQTSITLKDVIFTKKLSMNNEERSERRNQQEEKKEENRNTKGNEMYHIVPPTDYRRNSHHLRPFDTHWGNNILSRSIDQMSDKSSPNKSRKTYSFDECDSTQQSKLSVIRTNSFDSRHKSDICNKTYSIQNKPMSIRSDHGSRTSSSISVISIPHNYNESNAGNKINKSSSVYTRVRSCTKLRKDISSVNSSFNSSSETNNCMIRSSHEINRPLLVKNKSISGRRKCNSERSPVRKVVVTRITSKSLESKNNTWQPSPYFDHPEHIKEKESLEVLDNKYPNPYIQKQNSECYLGIAKYPSSQYRQSQFMRHKSMEVSKNMDERRRNLGSSYSRINTETDKNQYSLESEETFGRNEETHLSRLGLMNISIDNSDYLHYRNYHPIPDVVNSSFKEDKSFRESLQKTTRTAFQNLCRSNTNLEISNNLVPSAAIRRRQFSQERRKINHSQKDSKGSLSKSVYDDYSFFTLENLDDKKGKSMIFDRFFSSQLLFYENIETKSNKLPTKHQYNNDINFKKEYNPEEIRTVEDDSSYYAQCHQRFPSKYVRSKSQNHDSMNGSNDQPVPYNDILFDVYGTKRKHQTLSRRQMSEKDVLSKCIDRNIPTIVYPDYD